MKRLDIPYIAKCDTSIRLPLFKDNRGIFIRYGKNETVRSVKEVTCKQCNTMRLITCVNDSGINRCSKCIGDNLNTKEIEVLTSKHIETRINRHYPYNTIFKEMSDIVPVLNGSVLSLPSLCADVDTNRILTHFSRVTKFIWYEWDKRYFNVIRHVADKYNQINAGIIQYQVFKDNILEANHSNVSLINLDLECQFTETLQRKVSSLVRRVASITPICITLNVSTRGPKGMTYTGRMKLWNKLIYNLNRIILYNNNISYHSRESGGMLLLGAVLK
ncbi:hypothetical protein H8D85_00510 [bacterium]|nr:hypothetical protein [bacterium]